MDMIALLVLASVAVVGPATGGGHPVASIQTAQAFKRHALEAASERLETADVEQVPVVEDIEKIDSPDADQDAGDTEAESPTVDQGDDEVGGPAAEPQPDVEQPGIEP